MKIYFVEPEPSDTEFFEEVLSEHEVFFAESDLDVDPDCEILSVYIHSEIDNEFLDRHPKLKFIRTGKADQLSATVCCGVCSGGRQPPNSIRAA